MSVFRNDANSFSMTFFGLILAIPNAGYIITRGRNQFRLPARHIYEHCPDKSQGIWSLCASSKSIPVFFSSHLMIIILALRIPLIEEDDLKQSDPLDIHSSSPWSCAAGKVDIPCFYSPFGPCSVARKMKTGFVLTTSGLTELWSDMSRACDASS